MGKLLLSPIFRSGSAMMPAGRRLRHAFYPAQAPLVDFGDAGEGADVLGVDLRVVGEFVDVAR
jgi:hypothetical protein